MENTIINFKKKYKLRHMERVKDIGRIILTCLQYLSSYILWVGAMIIAHRYSIVIYNLENLGLITLFITQLFKRIIKCESYGWKYWLHKSVETIVILAIIGWLIELTVMVESLK